jgi:glycosyltransferase involved in cell wall biosynthesis
VRSLWLLVAGDFTPLGGMDAANHGLASYLARRPGTEVHLVTHRAWPDLEVYRSVRVHWVPRPLGRQAIGEMFLRGAARRAADKIARRGGRVVVNGGNCDYGDVNWVHYVHAAWTPKAGPGLARRMKTAAYHRTQLAAEGASLWRARVIIANSERTRSVLIDRLKLAPERIHTIYYGIDPVRFRPPTPDERAEARRRLRWRDERPTLAFVGALGDLRKGLDTLLAAWRRLCADRMWDARLAVLGTGPMLRQLRKQYRDLRGSVSFLRFRRDVPDVLFACDALASPVRYEAYGLNVHEAICCGLPAFVTESAGVAERYPPELRELLIPDPEDITDIAARLRRWRDDPKRLVPAVSAFSDKLRAYTWDDMAERLVGVVDRTM